MTSRTSLALASKKRDDQAFDLRMNGASFVEIGKALGVHQVRARQLYLRACRRKDQEAEIVAALVRALETNDPAAFVQTPVRGERTAIDGCFDLYAVVAAWLDVLPEAPNLGTVSTKPHDGNASVNSN